MQITSWIQLCLHELEGAPIKEHSDIEASFAESERFSKWKTSKREIRLEEVMIVAGSRAARVATSQRCTYMRMVHLMNTPCLDAFTPKGIGS